MAPDRAFVYKVQLGLGRSARDIQQRLARFAAEGDTATEAGLGQLLQQTSLELMRAQAIRSATARSKASGPMSLTNGETKMNAAALAERSRFHDRAGARRGRRGAQVGRGRRREPGGLEYLVVTVVLATRAPVLPRRLTDHDELQPLLGQLGGCRPRRCWGWR